MPLAIAPGEAEELLNRSARLGTFPAVFNNIESLAPAGTVPADSAWRGVFQRNYVRNLALDHEETSILERLSRAGILCRAIKGVRSVKLLYPDLSWRKVVDIDLLVPPDQVKAAYQALRDMGLRDSNAAWTSAALDRQIAQPDHAFAELVLGSSYGTIVELHWDWTGESFPEGEPILDPEAFMVYMCRHAGKHFWSSLHMICDIELYLRKFGGSMDWGRVRTLARSSGWERMCEASLELCSLLFGRPAQGEKRSRAARSLAREAARSLVEERRPWWWKSKPLQLLRVYTWRQRISRCWRWLAPPPWHWNKQVSGLRVWLARYRRLGFELLARMAPSRRWRDRMQKAAALSGRDWRFLAEAWLVLGAVRIALAAVSFQRIQLWAGEVSEASPMNGRGLREHVARAAWLVDVAANHHVVRMLCLPRSVALLRMLARLGQNAELKIGVRLEGEKLLAHAWVEWNGERLNDPYATTPDYAELRVAAPHSLS